jgi:NAD(P)-dependent dehydrogenase (short-subunit alcohol dehydrogenase family)
VSNTEQVQVAIDAALAMAPLRALVNGAGIGSAGRTVDRSGNPFDLASFEMVIKVNLIGTFNCIRLAAAAMSKQEPVNEDGCRGAIVNMASVAAFDGQIGQCAYSASKGGVVGMTLPIARDLSASGIRVNTVAPGLFNTPIYGEGEASEEFKTHLGKSVLFPKRLGYADELASMVSELITNDYMNGEVVRADGGIRMPPK